MIGPGYGESIVIHLGGGDWVIIDSCYNSKGESAALRYLRDIGVDPAKNVRLILATHWHDDHIGGLASVVKECENAEFSCAGVLSEKEFLTFASTYAEDDPSPIYRAAHQIIDILETLTSRDKHPRFAVQDRMILQTDLGVRVYALSPSDNCMAEFIADVSNMIPPPKQPRRRVGDLAPNKIAVAVMIDFGTCSILLGADLQETPGSAWSTILSSSQVIGESRSSLFKVPHHGSVTGDCPAVWKDVLVSAPFAILTPFRRGSSQVPNEDEVGRILGRTPNAYSTARLTSVAPRHRAPSVERTLREYDYNIQALEPKLGQVRLRRSLSSTSGPWAVELIDNAVRLQDIRR